MRMHLFVAIPANTRGVGPGFTSLLEKIPRRFQSSFSSFDGVLWTSRRCTPLIFGCRSLFHEREETFARRPGHRGGAASSIMHMKE
jgi:hypothetical protein